jgi:hypothetical protein
MTVDFGGEAHELPRGAVIGVIGDNGSGVSSLLQAAGGRFIGPGHDLDLTELPLLCLGYVLDLRDEITRTQAEIRFESLRRAGSTVLLASQHREILRRCSDEVWWVHEGEVRCKGDVHEVLEAYARHAIDRVRRTEPASLAPSLRRGDGRAELVALEAPGSVMSGADMEVRVTVRFHADVAEPVVGIMIRTRIGMEVYGTNTELEGVKLGPCRTGDTRRVSFRFACNLCPQTYTLTAASHDPDGVWHDWMEDALAFQVADTRYTAGVANLRAHVTADGDPIK